MSTVARDALQPPSVSSRPAAGVAAVLAPLIGRLDTRAPQPRGFTLRFWDGSELPAAAGAPDPPVLIFRSPDALVYLLRSPGELGFSRAWVSGALDVDGDLARAFILTDTFRRAPLEAGDALPALRAIRRLGLLRRPVPPPPECEAQLGGRRHSKERDRAAISHHYDVSNEFYRRMLGPTMVYSCAYFASQGESLDEAQTRKLDLICRKLELREGERLLDIGCGWGSLLIHAAREYGVRGVGVTVSQAQAELARECVREAGLQDRLEIRPQDYRETDDGPYDKIASIGMFEHVGAANLALYLERTHALLEPGGLFLNHGIVRPRPRPMDPDSFTVRYVFPDGELHSQGHVIEAYEAAGFELRDDESLRQHYAQTLRCWAQNMDAHRAENVAEIGEERERVWRLHNVGAAIGFERGGLSIHQALLAPLAGAAAAPLRVRSFG
ncbi:MAG TPA: cyclopropane-fatty-acyl-phospholipid synthase family protein [Solirubrobacteraceae bacterium]